MLTSMTGEPSRSMTLNGQWTMSFLTSASSNRRPMRRFASKTVWRGFMAAWFLRGRKSEHNLVSVRPVAPAFRPSFSQ